MFGFQDCALSPALMVIDSHRWQWAAQHAVEATRKPCSWILSLLSLGPKTSLARSSLGCSATEISRWRRSVKRFKVVRKHEANGNRMLFVAQLRAFITKEG